MALFNANLGTSLGLGQALQAKPDTYANIAESNIQYNRAEIDRKRKEAEKQREEEDARYAHLLDKIKVEGYGPLWDSEISRKAANVIGKMADYRAQNPHRDPLSDPNINKSYQDLLIQSGEAKKAAEAANKTLETAFNNPDKQSYDPEILQAIHTGDREKFKELTGIEPEKYHYGLGLKPIEKQFDDLTFKKKVNEAFKPFDKTIEFKDPSTGNWITRENNYYNDPNSSVKEALSSDPKAQEFYKKRFDEMSIQKQKEYTAKALSDNGTGIAYLEYAKERLFPEGGTKSKTTIQEPTGGKGSGKEPKFNTSADLIVDRNGVHTLSFSRTDVTENKPYNYEIDGKVIQAVPLKIQGTNTKNAIATLGLVDDKGKLTGEEKEVPAQIVEPSLRTNFGGLTFGTALGAKEGVSYGGEYKLNKFKASTNVSKSSKKEDLRNKYKY